MRIEDELLTACEKLLNKLGIDTLEGTALQLHRTRKEFEGDFTLMVFPYVKQLRKSPEQAGQQLGEELKNNNPDLVESFNVVKGFLNIKVKESLWLEFFDRAIGQKHYGRSSENGVKTMVEYASPNTNKPLHLGHLRNIFLGHAVSEILAAAGHHVTKVQIINDRGIHICKSMLAWQKFGKGETPETTGMKGDHLVGKYYVEFDKQYKQQISALQEEGQAEEEAKKNAPILLEAQEMLRQWEAGDKEVTSLWERMNSWVYQGFDQTYQTIGTAFDKLYYESNTYLLGKDIVVSHLDSELIHKKQDGSIWIDLTSEKLDEKLLLRSDGTSVYMTQDIGTAVQRHQEYDCKEYVYVVGNEQDYHFNVLAIILQKMGYGWAEGIEHLSYGMVDLPSGKMKSREGTVVDADDLMEEMKNTAKEISVELGKLDNLDEEEQDRLYHQIGMGALKYFILKVDPKKKMLFDPKESVDFAGNTGPFIQYAYARIQSILRKASNMEMPDFSTSEMNARELTLIKRIYEYPQVIKDAAANRSPALVANYVYELVKEYNNFYQNVPILKESDKSLINFRLQLSSFTGKVIHSAMNLLGIQVPEQM